LLGPIFVVPISRASQRGPLPTHTGSASLLNGPQAAEEGSAGRLGAWGAGRERPARRCSSGVEQLTCNQQVVGSTPTIGSRVNGSRGQVRRGTQVAKGSRL